MPLFDRIPCLRTSLITGSLVLLALAVSLDSLEISERRVENVPPGWSAEELTPDSDPPPQTGSPDKLRHQHLTRLGAARWHADGVRGRGVKVAVLDSGFRGYRQYVGQALPAQVLARSFRPDGNLEARDSQHGILCGEVVNAVAPAAQLLLANWEADQPSSFLNAIRWARQQGAKIITCSLIMPSWSDGEGGGDVNQTLARIVGDGKSPGDVLFFASAGNTAQRHWTGKLKLTPEGYHQWKTGQSINRITPWGDERVAVELYGPSVGDLELVVRDADTGEPVTPAVVRGLAHDAPGSRCLVVRFLPPPRHKYEVTVRSPSGRIPATNAPFHLVVLGGSLSVFHSKGSICCPADGPGAIAVGAVDAEGNRLHYSSCGPNSRLPKPDLVAEVPFPSLWRNRPFAGTSAAAPQAAGLAALLWSKNPTWSADQVRQVLQRSSRDLGPAGHDWETGHGLIVLPAPGTGAEARK